MPDGDIAGTLEDLQVRRCSIGLTLRSQCSRETLARDVQSVILPNPGETLYSQGRTYTIGGKLGKGHFSHVFECTDDWGNSLAAKVLLPTGSYSEVQQSWIRELSNLTSCRHPNITYIHDAFERESTFYIILERCDWSLNSLFSMPGLIGEVWLLPVAKCVLRAVDFIHRAKYVHKDIHPGNVMSVSTYDEMLAMNPPAVTFKVGDLGISRLLSDVDVFGTVLANWMHPPEYLKPDEFGVIDWNVDIYHVGLLLLSLLVGHVPQFTQEEIIEGAPRKMAEQLDSPYAPALSRALRRHVSARTQTALDFWRDLNRQ